MSDRERMDARGTTSQEKRCYAASANVLRLSNPWAAILSFISRRMYACLRRFWEIWAFWERFRKRFCAEKYRCFGKCTDSLYAF